MNLNEAIRHCEEVAEKCPWPGCVTDHKQLASWLRELRDYKSKGQYIKLPATPFKIDENSNRWHCGHCSTALGRFWKYCQKCGRKIDWEAADDHRDQR